jgi:hemolysin activation/secretion protein
MTRIDIKDPINSGIPPVDLQGMTMLKNENYYLTTSYTKELGTWTFTFTGNRSSDNSGFVSYASMNVTGK